MIISNLGNLGYIDKKRYDSQGEVVLTAKGETKVKEAITKALV
jgi:Mn-dependent DtxR family transcriptional regulator